jgi:hypothetical protein
MFMKQLTDVTSQIPLSLSSAAFMGQHYHAVMADLSANGACSTSLYELATHPIQHSQPVIHG